MVLCYNAINFNELSLQLSHHLREINLLHENRANSMPLDTARANIPLKVCIDTDNVNIKAK